MFCIWMTGFCSNGEVNLSKVNGESCLTWHIFWCLLRRKVSVVKSTKTLLNFFGKSSPNPTAHHWKVTSHLHRKGKNIIDQNLICLDCQIWINRQETKVPQNREGIKIPEEREKRGKKGLGKHELLSHAYLNLLHKSVELHSEGRSIKRERFWGSENSGILSRQGEAGTASLHLLRWYRTQNSSVKLGQNRCYL